VNSAFLALALEPAFGPAPVEASDREEAGAELMLDAPTLGSPECGYPVMGPSWM
jgi:hypothetical protein